MDYSDVTEKNKGRCIDVLLAMHSYNDAAGRFHEESSRKSVNFFILIYLFLLGVILANGPNAACFVTSIFLLMFSRLGFKISSVHSHMANMHYFRNRDIRNQLDQSVQGIDPSLYAIFENARQTIAGLARDNKLKLRMMNYKRFALSSYSQSWANVHNFFSVFSAIALVCCIVNLTSCSFHSGCLWPTGSDHAEKLAEYLLKPILRFFPPQ